MPRYATDLRQRARSFGLDAYKLARHARAAHPALRNACDQMFDAATSVGANLAESDGLNSRKELAARYAIALKEARETFYWLDLMRTAEPDLAIQIAPLLAECKEFIAMLSTALRKLRT